MTSRARIAGSQLFALLSLRGSLARMDNDGHRNSGNKTASDVWILSLIRPYLVRFCDLVLSRKVSPKAFHINAVPQI